MPKCSAIPLALWSKLPLHHKVLQAGWCATSLKDEPSDAAVLPLERPHEVHVNDKGVCQHEEAYGGRSLHVRGRLHVQQYHQKRYRKVPAQVTPSACDRPALSTVQEGPAHDAIIIAPRDKMLKSLAHRVLAQGAFSWSALSVPWVYPTGGCAQTFLSDVHPDMCCSTVPCHQSLARGPPLSKGRLSRGSRCSPEVQQPGRYQRQAAGGAQAQNAQTGQGPLHQALPDAPCAVQVHRQQRELGARVYTQEVLPEVEGVVPAGPHSDPPLMPSSHSPCYQEMTSFRVHSCQADIEIESSSTA